MPVWGEYPTDSQHFLSVLSQEKVTKAFVLNGTEICDYHVNMQNIQKGRQLLIRVAAYVASKQRESPPIIFTFVLVWKDFSGPILQEILIYLYHTTMYLITLHLPTKLVATSHASACCEQHLPYEVNPASELLFSQYLDLKLIQHSTRKVRKRTVYFMQAGKSNQLTVPF